MAIVWTPDIRKAISRRIVKIPIENEAFDTSKSGLDDTVVAFQNVDDGNKEWFDLYNDDICLRYENEKRLIDGLLLGQVIEQNLDDSASQTDYNIFFKKGLDYNPYMYPLINYMVHGLYANPFKSDGQVGGTFTVWEVNGLQGGQDIVISDNGAVGDSDTNYDLYLQNIGVGIPSTLTIFNRATGAAFDLSAYTAENEAYIKTVVEAAYEKLDIINEYISILVDGFIVGSGATVQLAAAHIPHARTILVNANTLINGEFVICDDGVDGAVFELTSGPVPSGPNFIYSIREVFVNGNITIGTNVSNNFIGFTNIQRQNLVAAPYNNVLNQMADEIDLLVWNNPPDSWKDILADEAVELNANEEDRVAQQAQIVTALADIVTALAQIAIWEAYPQIGVTGRFSDGEVDVLRNELVARIAFTEARLIETATALGDVVDNSGSYTFGIDATDIYFRRYRTIDYRINRIYGSLSKVKRQTGASSTVGQLKDVNDGWESEYDVFMKAVRFSYSGNNTNKISLEGTTDFSIGDTVYVISEEEAELSGVIIAISDSTASLDINITEDYKVVDLARIYKTL